MGKMSVVGYCYDCFTVLFRSSMRPTTAKANSVESVYVPATSRLPATPRSSVQSYKIPQGEHYTKFFQQDLFCEKLKTALMKQFPVEVQIIYNRGDGGDVGEKTAYAVEMSGSEIQQLTSAYDALELLMIASSLKKKIFDGNIGNITLRYLFLSHSYLT